MIANGAIPRSCPYSALAVLKENGGGEISTVDGGSVTLIENLKANSVEANEAPAGCKPQIAVSGLKDRQDRIVRQAVLGIVELKSFLTIRERRRKRYPKNYRTCKP